MWSLVLWAAGIEHGVQHDKSDPHLVVQPDDFERASHEIYLYELENPEVTEGAVLPEQHFQPPTFILMGCLALWYGHTGQWAGESHWFTRGAVKGSNILEQYEWWRLITGLTLHADFVHLVGNVVLGGVVIHLLCKMTGTGLGLFLVILSGLLGNLFNVLCQPLSHVSVGFSTAVFGAIGCLSGLDIVRRRSLRGVVIAVGAGFALLAMLGTGSDNVDLGAHLWGFGVGVVLGFVSCIIALKRQGFPQFFTQLVFFVVACSLLVGSWHYALAG
ncbi:MAG: rhomboid family intramembrane serine protease [Spirochaetales bacterium]|nr:rhomboid family intramembrane serine protease [Spirochaetales bacterium]